jgi:hypothetical protein
MCDVPRELSTPLAFTHVTIIAPKRCLIKRHIAEMTYNQGLVFVDDTFWFLETESKQKVGEWQPARFPNIRLR